jgi:hypothetical protein
MGPDAQCSGVVPVEPSLHSKRRSAEGVVQSDPLAVFRNSAVLKAKRRFTLTLGDGNSRRSRVEGEGFDNSAAQAR